MDLAVAGYGYVEIYRNEGAKLASVPTWSAVELGGVVHSLAWGDVNGDRLPDLAVGAEGSSGVYLNLADGLLSETPYWLLPELQWTTSVAWGDVNYDGKLDLALSGFGHDMSCDCYRHEVVIYLNVDGVLQNPMYIPIESNAVYSIAWRDINRDGYPELAVATGSQAAVYINARGVLTSTKAWRPAESDSTSVVAWQDVDGDGDADLTTGNAGVNRIYRNDNGELQPQAIWTSGVDDYITSIAWGDVDGDGDPDLAAAIYGYDEECECSASTIQIYFTERTILQSESVWNPDLNRVYSIAWGDVDRDGDLDLAVGTGAGNPVKVYRNDSGALQATVMWQSVENDFTQSVAWGDVNGDGWLDLAVGNVAAYDFDCSCWPSDSVNKIYLNHSGHLSESSDWQSEERDDTYSVAWGDVNGDGNLDLAVGNAPTYDLVCDCYKNGENRIYMNMGVTLGTTASWWSDDADDTWSIAWADMDNDGDLDLAAGNTNFEANKVYTNVGDELERSPSWQSVEADYTQSVAWGDVNGDGFIDLAVGNQGINQVYLNEHGVLTNTASWSSTEWHSTSSVAWGDVDGDGDLDLAAGNYGESNQIYQNDRGVLQLRDTGNLGDLDNTRS
ncbi:MAG: VCBS repeat-containing protein, partial [Caldilineaceae bacterium]|nr:VCBS repeat-containing protein [Caldilineaceae bacterium]